MAEVLSRKPPHQESKEWQCPQCTAINSHENIDCCVCFKQKPGRSRLSSHLEEEQNKLPEEGPVKQSFVDNVRSLVLGKPAPWRCPRCTCEMGGYYNKCSACGFLRTDVRRKSESSSVISWFSLFRRSPEQSKRSSHQQATSVDPELDSGFQDSSGNSGWDCPHCTFRNSEKAKACHMCEHSKPRGDHKKKRKQHKENDIGESFEVINFDEDLIRVTPSLIEGINGSPFLEDENNLSLLQNHSSNTFQSVAEESTELVLPHSSCSPQHQIHLSLPSPPAQPLQPHPSTSASQTRLKPQTAILSNPNTQSWKCSVCGAFNLIFLPNQRCFVCGIGLIPNMPSDIEMANNKTQLDPGALVVHNHPTPRPQAGHGELVYTTQPNAITPMPPNSGHHHSSHVSVVPNGQIEQPQRPTRLTQREQGSGSERRRRRDSSIRRSAEEPLSTPGGNATVLLKLVKHQYELEADRIYKGICQYCKKVRERE